jgi:hypothetical protein
MRYRLGGGTVTGDWDNNNVGPTFQRQKGVENPTRGIQIIEQGSAAMFTAFF